MLYPRIYNTRFPCDEQTSHIKKNDRSKITGEYRRYCSTMYFGVHTQSTRATTGTLVRTKFLQLYTGQGIVQAYRAYKNRPGQNFYMAALPRSTTQGGRALV
eukprot:SAG11_NODE_2565_length_3217_cov_3.113534_5_plen_102_part_00